MATTTLGDLLINIRLNGASSVNNQLNSVQSATKKLGKVMGTAESIAGGLPTVLLNIATSLGKIGFDIAIAGFKKLVEVMANGIDAGFAYNASLEQNQTAIRALTGDQEYANKLTEDMIKLAQETPYAFKDFTSITKTLLGYGVAQEEVMEDLSMLGDIAVGDSQAMSRLGLAFAQATAKGKLQAEEVRQMVNAGFNPLQVISEKTGKTIAQLTDEMRGGKITSEMMRDAFISATSEGGRFNGVMEEMSKTYKGQMEKLSEYGEMFWGNITKPFYDIVASNILPVLVQHVSALADKGTVMGEKLFSMAESAWNFIEPFREIIKLKIDSFVNRAVALWDKYKEAWDSLMSIFRTGDMETIEIALKALLPESLEGIAERLATSIYFLRGNVDEFIQSLVNILKEGDPDTITQVLSRFVPKEFAPLITNAVLLVKKMKGDFSKLVEFLRTNIPTVMDTVVRAFQKIYPVLQAYVIPIVKRFQEAFLNMDWSTVKDSLISLGESILNLYEQAKPALSMLGGLFITFAGTVYGIIAGIIEALPQITAMFTSIIAYVNTAVAFILSIFGGTVGETKALWADMAEQSKQIFGNMWDSIVTIVTSIKDTVVGLFTSLWDVLVGHSIIPDMVNAIITWFTSLDDRAIELIGSMILDIISKFTNLDTEGVNKVKSLYSGVTTSISNLKSKAITYITNMVSSAITKLSNFKSQGVQKAKDLAKNFLSALITMKSKVGDKMGEIAKIPKDKLKSLQDDAFSWGSNMIGMFIEGVASKATALKNKVSDLASTAKDYLGFSSPTKLGAGSNADEWMPNFMNMLMEGITDNLSKFKSTIQRVSNTMADNVVGTQTRGIGLNHSSFDTSLIGAGTGQQAVNTIHVTVNADTFTNGTQVGKQLVKELNGLGILTHRI